VSAPLARLVRTAIARTQGLLHPMAEALAFERTPRDTIDAEVNRKLSSLVRLAAGRTTHGRERFAAAGIDPARVRTIADLGTLPLLTKDDLRLRRNELLVDGRVDPDWIRNASGGSTGAPVEFYQDREYHRRMLADQARHVTWTRLPWWTPRAFAWGADRDSTAHTSTRGRVRDGVEGTAFLNTFRATDADYLAFASRCARARTPLLIGYASSLEHFARLLLARGDGAGWRPHAIQSSAERLSPEARAVLEQAFGAPVFDRYGSREMGNAAHECEAHVGLHVSMERVIVEIVRDGVPVADGHEGELAVTVLDNRAEPLIRYATGDLGRRLAEGPCPCGRAYERIEITAGRTSDLFTAPSGKRVHGEYFTHLFYGLNGIAEFRLTQQTREAILMEIVRGSGDVGADVAFVLAGIREIDPGFVVETRIVDAIPTPESGKRRFTVSMVPVEW